MAQRPLDIRIVGGGLAGLVTGLTLLEGPHAVDARVTIYERAPMPYTTLCGEGLSDDTLRMFSAFDSRPYVAGSFDESSWFFPGPVEVRIHQRGHTMAREKWIPAMAEYFQQLGGDYRTGVKVTNEMVDEMAREADVVVGADGPGSAVRHAVGGHHTTMLGIQYRVAREGVRIPERLEFYTDKAYSPEYAWVFPREDQLNVGLLASGDGQDWERLDRFMDDKGVAGKVIRREAYPIGFFGDNVQRDKLVLVGDAAGLTNPITKGGMAAAIYAADILSECIATDRLADYGRRIREHPISHPSFHPALDTLRRWSNRDFEKLARFAPPLIHVRPGTSTNRAYLGRLLATLATNPTRARDFLTVAKAMGVSRRYSW